MIRFELTPEMMTGEDRMDEEHLTIVELSNNFIDPYTLKAGDVLFQDALNCLVDYTLYHFAAEEIAMMEAGYPYYERHRQWHESFRTKMVSYMARGRTRNAAMEIRMTVSATVDDWLRNHVPTLDFEFAGFLREKQERIAVYHYFAAVP